MRALTSIEVHGLLGQFDHKVKFPEDSEFVIIHGPNGVGKTKLLELISAAFAGNWTSIMQIPFRLAMFGFSDGTALQISRSEQLALPLGKNVANDGEITITISLIPGDGDVEYKWESPASSEVMEAAYIDATTMERVYRDLSPSERRRFINRDLRLDSAMLADIVERSPRVRHIKPLPPEITNFFDEVNVHLIETQRLLNSGTKARRRPARDESEPQRATVIEYSQDITRRIREALAENSRRSQLLDRRFPRRLMTDEKLPAEATEEAIRNRYEEQGELRQRLSEISLLDAFPDMPLPAKSLADWQRRVLWTYLDDTDQKLATFAPLLDRIALLREIVNSRFLYKELRIDRDRGFYFVTPHGGEIDSGKLSSGEQHELVLTYDLLFNAPENALVLIDEPEISLHIAWQQEFLADIKRIANLNSLRFIIATHSPQVVHNWWSRTVALGPDDAD